MADHEDYLPGEAPTAHKTTHQDGGTDEISVGGLSGELADDQPPKAHDLGGPKHNADTLADLNTKVTDATLDDSGDPRDPNVHAASHENGGADEISIAGLAGEGVELGEHKILESIHHTKFTIAEHDVVLRHPLGNLDGNVCSLFNADTKITAHALLPTVHQDAPDLILTHKGDAAAHHAKYTDAEARAVLSPISIPPAAFLPYLDTYDFTMNGASLRNRISLTNQLFLAPLLLPNGATITKLSLYGYRDDTLSTLNLSLRRLTRTNEGVLMCAITSDWIDGWNTKYSEDISYPTINNINYSYVFYTNLDPNDSVDDVVLSGVKIDFTG